MPASEEVVFQVGAVNAVGYSEAATECVNCVGSWNASVFSHYLERSIKPLGPSYESRKKWILYSDACSLTEKFCTKNDVPCGCAYF